MNDALSTTDLSRLTLYRWRYVFEELSFDRKTANCLCFVLFWVRRGLIGGPRDGEARA